MSEVKIIDGYEFIPYYQEKYSDEETIIKSDQFYHWCDQRRSVRDFSSRDIPKKVIENILLAASTAPSGAHKQPWSFCAVHASELKKKIREAAEKEEYHNYTRRMSDQWKEDIQAFATNWEKPFLEIAPWLIIVFKKIYDVNNEGNKINNYYVNESVGLACGLLLQAIHYAGLVALTHTPSPMNFLEKILKRPANEKAFLLIPVGFPADDTYVPKLHRKTLSEVAEFFD